MNTLCPKKKLLSRLRKFRKLKRLPLRLTPMRNLKLSPNLKIRNLPPMRQLRKLLKLLMLSPTRTTSPRSKARKS